MAELASAVGRASAALSIIEDLIRGPLFPHLHRAVHGDPQLVDNVDFTLPKMSIITGRVLDEANEPISGVRVTAMRPLYFEGRRRLVPVGQPASMTDDAGQYRILGLTPGSYFVMAGINDTWTVVENGVERVMGYAQTYYPGVAGVTDARRVTVGVGQEASNTDFSLIPGRAATITAQAASMPPPNLT